MAKLKTANLINIAEDMRADLKDLKAKIKKVAGYSKARVTAINTEKSKSKDNKFTDVCDVCIKAFTQAGSTLASFESKRKGIKTTINKQITALKKNKEDNSVKAKKTERRSNKNECASTLADACKDMIALKRDFGKLVRLESELLYQKNHYKETMKNLKELQESQVNSVINESIKNDEDKLLAVSKSAVDYIKRHPEDVDGCYKINEKLTAEIEAIANQNDFPPTLKKLLLS